MQSDNMFFLFNRPTDLSSFEKFRKLIGTEIFQFGQLEAEKFAFIDLYGSLSTGCLIKIRLCFGRLWHLQFKVIFKCRECFGILLSSAFQCILKLCDYHKNGTEN